jgi:hypothetical protein
LRLLLDSCVSGQLKQALTAEGHNCHRLRQRKGWTFRALTADSNEGLHRRFVL